MEDGSTKSVLVLFTQKPPALLITVAADAEKDKKSDLHDFVKLYVCPDQGLEAPTKI